MSTYIRTWTVLVRVNTGPPTWWRPRLDVGKGDWVFHVRAGWLRACVQIGLGSRTHQEAAE